MQVQQQRFKKGKGKAAKGEQEDQESDDEDEGSDAEVDPLDLPEYHDFDAHVMGLRLDIVAKTVLPISREKATELINAGLVRLNGRTAGKADAVTELDVLDLIRGRNREDPKKIDVVRAEITSVADIATTKGRIRIRGRRWRVQAIENYKEEPYEGLIESAGDDEPEGRAFR